MEISLVAKVALIILGTGITLMSIPYIISLVVGFVYVLYNKATKGNYIETLGVRLKVENDGTCIISDDQKLIMTGNLNVLKTEWDRITTDTLATQALINPESIQKEYPHAMAGFILTYCYEQNKKELELVRLVSSDKRQQILDQWGAKIDYNSVLGSKGFRTWLRNRMNKDHFNHSMLEKLNEPEKMSIFLEELCKS